MVIPVKIISEAELKSEKSRILSKNSYSWLQEAISARKRNNTADEVVIFLSHKHGEKELVENIIAVFNDLEVEVYVDWLDDEMPKHTNGFTAKQIKQKIKNCDKFVLLATEEAIASKWCNWELGFGDAKKYESDKIAIFPIKKNYQDFTGSEYLAIYPYVVFSDHWLIEETSAFDDLKWKVRYPDNREDIYLKKWLKQD